MRVERFADSPEQERLEAVPTSLQQEHLQRLAQLGAWSAGLAHEMKNALVPLKTMVQLLAQKHPEDELAPLAEREIGRLDELVGRMLRLAAPARQEMEPQQIQNVLQHCLRVLQPTLDQKSIQVRYVKEAQFDRVNGINHQLQQAFMNLLLNAMDAVQGPGEVRITTGNAARLDSALGVGQWLRVTIADSGCGIRPQDLSRLFEPFFTTKHGGTGLGLPITQRIIQDHGGSISVESEPGRGTSFKVLLPLAG